MKRSFSLLVCILVMISVITTGAYAESSGRLGTILENGYITVATSPDYPPFEFEDITQSGDERYVGADMDLARYVAEQLGVSLKIEPMDFDACLAAVVSGSVDLCIAGLTPDETRAQVMDFTDIYSDEGDRCVVIRAEDAEKYKSIMDFADAKIACLNGSSGQSVVEQYLSADNMERVASFNDGLLMLRTGKVEGVSMSTVSASNYVNNSDDLAIMEEYFPYDEEMGLAIGVVKGEPELLARLNEIISSVSEQGLFQAWTEGAYELSNSMMN